MSQRHHGAVSAAEIRLFQQRREIRHGPGLPRGAKGPHRRTLQPTLYCVVLGGGDKEVHGLVGAKHTQGMQRLPALPVGEVVRRRLEYLDQVRHRSRTQPAHLSIREELPADQFSNPISQISHSYGSSWFQGPRRVAAWVRALAVSSAPAPARAGFAWLATR